MHNFEALMGCLDDYHKDTENKTDLSLVVQRVAFWVFLCSKLIPWCHYGTDLNMGVPLLTKASPPPTPKECCRFFKGVLHRSRDADRLDTFLAGAGKANPHWTSDLCNNAPHADEIIDGKALEELAAE